jgi:hypothetical protein
MSPKPGAFKKLKRDKLLADIDRFGLFVGERHVWNELVGSLVWKDLVEIYWGFLNTRLSQKWALYFGGVWSATSIPVSARWNDVQTASTDREIPTKSMTSCTTCSPSHGTPLVSDLAGTNPLDFSLLTKSHVQGNLLS